MIAFLAAIFFLLITPGPGVLSTAGVGSAFGKAAAYRYIGGLFIGTNLVALAVVTGVASFMLASPAIRTLLLWASISYLFYLAVRIAYADTTIAFIKKQKPPGIISGVALQAINPKAYVVNTTLFAGFPFEQVSQVQEIMWKFLLINAIWIPIHVLWMFAGIALKEMNLPTRWQRIINRLMALSLITVVILAAVFRPN